MLSVTEFSSCESCDFTIFLAIFQRPARVKRFIVIIFSLLNYKDQYMGFVLYLSMTFGTNFPRQILLALSLWGVRSIQIFFPYHHIIVDMSLILLLHMTLPIAKILAVVLVSAFHHLMLFVKAFLPYLIVRLFLLPFQIRFRVLHYSDQATS